MNRRRFLMAAPAFLAAPALVRATSIMPVRAVPVDCPWHDRGHVDAIEVMMRMEAGLAKANALLRKSVENERIGNYAWLFGP